MSNFKELTEKVKQAMDSYSERYPEVSVDRDYFPFKITEEWGECLQTYLMLTDRGRQKDKTKEQIQKDFSHELADVFGFLMLFAEREGIDIEKALADKWFKHLK